MAKHSWKAIADEISRRIGAGELEIGTRIPSGDEIAQDWGVTRHTAHRAISELQRQGLVVRQRRWGTVVAPPQKGKVASRVMLLVDILAPQTNFPSSDLIKGIHTRLGEDVQLMIASSNGDWQQEARQIKKLAGDVDGLLLWPTAAPQNTPLIRQLVDDGYPLVILDRVPEGVRVNSVVSDNESVTLHAIRLLEERGHRRIGFFSFDKPSFSSVTERHSAYKKALEEVGISDPTQYTRWFLNELNNRPQHFYQAVRDALFTLTNQPERISALFCVQDSLASFAIQACEELGISIPENLELVTFNDWPPLMLRIPWSVHRIVQRTYEIGVLAADLLLKQIADPAREPEALRVPADFYIADAGLLPASLLASETNGG